MNRFIEARDRSNKTSSINSRFSLQSRQDDAVPSFGPQFAQVMVKGHSFVNRLQSYVHIHKPHTFSGINSKVELLGRSGAHLRHMEAKLNSDSTKFKDSYVVLQIGGNDLNSDEVVPRQLAREIVNLARKLVNDMGIRYVTICQLLYRKQTIAARFVLRQNYNLLVKQVNLELDFLCTFFPKIRFWTHKRMNEKWQHYLSHDGVHLNEQGTVRFCRSVRGAVLHGPHHSGY